MLEENVHYLIGYGGIIIKGNEITINLCLCYDNTFLTHQIMNIFCLFLKIYSLYVM